MKPLLTLTLVLLMAGLLDRAWSFEQARAGGNLNVGLCCQDGPEAAAPLRRVAEDGGASGEGNEPGRRAATPSAGEPMLGATHSALTAERAVPVVWRAYTAPVSSAPTAIGEQASPAESSSRTESIRANWPTRAAMRWQPPRGFLQQAFCVHRHESVDWYRAYVDWRGQPSIYSGGLQFTLSTWRRAGGTGHPHEWRPREQVYRAWRIWRLYRNERRPGSWHEWGTRGKCGLA